MAGEKITPEQLRRTLEAAEALHALAIYDIDGMVLELLIDSVADQIRKYPGNYGLKHRWRMLIGLRAWRRTQAKDQVQIWY